MVCTNTCQIGVLQYGFEHNILRVQVDVILFDFMVTRVCSYEFSVCCRWLEMLLLMSYVLTRHSPINVTVPGGAISLSSCLSNEKACLN
jgi:hypothetical protein